MNREVLALMLSLILALSGFIVNSFASDALWQTQRASSPMIWTIVIETDPAPVEQHSTLLLPRIEQILRNEGDLNELILEVHSEAIVVHFYTDVDTTQPEILRSQLNARLRGLRSEPGFNQSEATITYKPLVRNSGGFWNRIPDKISFWNEVQKWSKAKESDGSPLKKLRGEISVVIPSGPEKLDLSVSQTERILYQIQSIPGVMNAIAHDASLAAITVSLNLHHVFALGLSPEEILAQTRTSLPRSLITSQKQILPPLQLHVVEKSATDVNTLANLAIRETSDGPALRLSHVAEVKRSLMKVDAILANNSPAFLARHTTPIETHDLQHQPTLAPTITVFLTPDAPVNKIIKRLQAVFNNENLQDVQIVAPMQTPLIFRSSLAMMLSTLLSFIFMGYIGAKRFNKTGVAAFQALVQISISGILWLGALTALGLEPEGSSISVFALTTLAHVFARILLPVRKHTLVPLQLTLFSGACLVAFLVLPATVGESLPYNDPHVAACFFAHLAALAAYTVLPHRVSQEIKPLVSKRGSRMQVSIMRSSISLVGLITIPLTAQEVGSQLPTTETAYLKLSHPDNQDSSTSSQILGIENSAKSHGVTLESVRTQVLPHAYIKPKALKQEIPNLARPQHLRMAFSQQLAGELSGETTWRPPQVIFSKPFENDHIEGIQHWLESILVRFQNNDQLIPLNAIYDFSLEPAPTVRLSTAQGVTMLARISGERANIQSFISDLPQILGRDVDPMQSSWTVYNPVDGRAERSRFMTQTLFTLILVLGTLGGLFFGSITRWALATTTCALLLAAFATIDFISQSLASSVSTAMFPTPGVWVGMQLLLIWFIMKKTSDSRRRANMTLEQAFSAQILVCRSIRRFGLIPAALLATTAIVFPDFRQSLILLIAAWFSLAFILPDWLLLWVRAFERWNRFTLKQEILSALRAARQPAVILLLATCTIFTSSQAKAVASRSVNGGCTDTATAILPILGRPKGQEKPPVRAFLSERLMQETPCAWLDETLTEPIATILARYRSSAAQSQIIEDLAELVQNNRKRIDAEAIEKIQEHSQGQNALRTRIYGGYFEEFFGNISLTIIEFPDIGKPVLSKITIPESQQTEGISFLASFIRGESKKFFEELLGESARIPVYIESVESQDQHPISENLAQEIDLFLRSRFLFPISFDFFERKTFFRAEDDRESAKYILNVKIRKHESRLFASITTTAPSGQRRQAWIESDINQLPAFEEEILTLSKKDLTYLEGIVDYGIVVSTDSLFNQQSWTRLYGIAFRQNFGNAGIGFRFRGGSFNLHYTPIAGEIYSFGSAVGWQFSDFRWFVADAGISLDLGFVSAHPPENLSPTDTIAETSTGRKRYPFFTYGPYAQAQLISRRQLTVIGRVGLEQPQLLGSEEARSQLFDALYINLMLGVGIAF